MRLKEQTAIITGAASGIGRATALLFAGEGAAVALFDRDEAGARETAAMIIGDGGRAMTFTGDVGVPGTAEPVVEKVLSEWARVDVLVTAAAFSVGGTVLTTSPEDWRAVFDANVGGTWLWARAVIPQMQRQKSGAIVTFASQLALAGGRGNSAYIAAKGAILSLTRTMALDFAADGIRINAVVPGAIDTPMLRRSFSRRPDPDAAREASRARHPMGRFGAAEEVASAVLYLASGDAAFTTGIALPVDGGWLAG